MSDKNKYNIWIPDQTAEHFLDLEEFVDQLIAFYPFLSDVDFEEMKSMKDLDKQVDETTEEYSKLCQQVGKIMQEYGVINFRGSELFTRNTVTGIKLGLLMRKLTRAKSIWGEKINIDYEAAKELIQHFSDRYLMIKDEE
ncbi:MAG: hypothetical protein ACTSQ4_10650 [Candidatus Heimdallarchaeaceae archaeon]